MPKMKKIGVLTGGGDAPGLNAVIRAVVKSAYNAGVEVIGLEDSFDGLIYPEKSRPLVPRDVTGILRLGGTMLGTVNRGNPFIEPIVTPQGTFNYADRVVDMFGKMSLDALVCIGGDGTLAISYEFYKMGVPLVCVPKTIDNDIVGTTSCFGFDTAVDFATDAIDRLHSTAEAHRRIMVVEVMGRYAGWIALHSGVAGGADVILIPEIPYDVDKVAACIRDRDARGARFSIVVVAEGARPIRRVTVADRSRRRADTQSVLGERERCARNSLKNAPAKRRVTSCSATCSAADHRRRSIERWRPGSAERLWTCSCTGSSGRWLRTIRLTSCRSRSAKSSARSRPCRSTTTCC